MNEKKVAKELTNIAKLVTAGSTEQRELELYIVNDGDLYRRQVQPIIKNLQRKAKKGVYDPDKAVKLWMYLVDAGAQKYNKDFGSPGVKWHEVFPKRDRQAVAVELRDYYEEEIMEGITASSKTAARSRKAMDPDWDEEFDMNGFTEDYRDDLDVSEDKYGNEVATLGRALKQELKKTYRTFESLDRERDLQKMADDEAKEIEKWISSGGNIVVYPSENEQARDEDYEYELRNIKVKGSFGDQLGAYYMTFTLQLKDGTSVDFEPGGFYYNDSDNVMYDAVREWDWAAWLGSDESPMWDQDFVNAYELDQTYYWFEQAAEWQSFDLVDKVEELLIDAGYNPDKVK